MFRRYDRRVFGLLMRRTRCAERAADLHQELFLRIHRFRDHSDPEQSFAPWFFGVARNVWNEDVRRRHRMPNEVHDVSGEGLPAADDLEGSAGDREVVGQLLATLGPSQQALVIGTTVEGFSDPDLAAELGRSAGSLKLAGSRALRRWRRLARERT